MFDPAPKNILDLGRNGLIEQYKEIGQKLKAQKMFIKKMESLMDRYKVFMKRFELSEDFQAKMTVEQLKTQLSQFGITPDQMFDQMNKTLIRMKDELDKTS